MVAKGESATPEKISRSLAAIGCSLLCVDPVGRPIAAAATRRRLPAASIVVVLSCTAGSLTSGTTKRFIAK